VRGMGWVGGGGVGEGYGVGRGGGVGEGYGVGGGVGGGSIFMFGLFWGRFRPF
jgi:hypothetical protein